MTINIIIIIKYNININTNINIKNISWQVRILVSSMDNFRSSLFRWDSRLLVRL